MVSLQLQENIVDYLNAYCFEEIWSAVGAQYRANFQLNPLETRLQTNVFIYNTAVVGLPTTGMYRVFYFDQTALRGSWNKPDGVWYSTDYIANQSGLKLSVYDVNGHLMPMSQVWIMTPKIGNIFFIALNKDALVTCIPQGISTDLYMTVFKTAQLGLTPWQIYSTCVTNAVQIQGIISQANTYTGTVVVINGISYTDLTTLPGIGNGQYVDVIADPTILTTYVVEVDNTNNGYQSTLYGDHREILHCPKAQNPNNEILTHDNATLFVRDKTTQQGVYFHRCDPDSVHQITHNDISASRTTINSFKAGLNASMVEVVVQVRGLIHTRTLIEEADWINELYLSDDAQIIQLLRGELGSNLTFWEAATLEQSPYIKLMFNVGDSLSSVQLQDYINALGFYETCSILSRCIYSGTFTPRDLVFRRSFIQSNKEITPLVYVNGVKQLQTNVNVSYFDKSRVGVSLSNESVLQNNSPCIIRTLDAGDLIPVSFTPTSSNPSILLPVGYSAVVYQKNTVSSQTGYKRSSDIAYSVVPLSGVTYQVFETNGQQEVTFDQGCFGKTFIFLPESFMWYEQNTIDDLLKVGAPLIFPLTVTDETGNIYPLLNYSNVEVYINGYYLVQDVDFTIGVVRDPNSDGIMMTDLIVSCASYLELEKSGNVLEIYVSSNYSLSRDVGYTNNNILARENVISFWFPQIGSAFIEGQPVIGLTDYAVYMESPTSVGNGSLFSLKPLLPAIIQSTLQDYSAVEDEETIEAINTFYNRTIPALPPIVNVQVEHQLYSPFLSAVMQDMVNGVITPIMDPSQSSFLSQFSSYDYLKNNDPTCNGSNPDVNRHYLSIAACYTQPPPMTVTDTQIIQKLISLTLITKPVVIQETLV